MLESISCIISTSLLGPITKLLRIVRWFSPTTKTCSLIVTRPAKTGHVGTNYILLLYTSYLSTETEYLNSVSCIIKPTKCLLRT